MTIPTYDALRRLAIAEIRNPSGAYDSGREPPDEHPLEWLLQKNPRPRFAVIDTKTGKSHSILAVDEKDQPHFNLQPRTQEKPMPNMPPRGSNGNMTPRGGAMVPRGQDQTPAGSRPRFMAPGSVGGGTADQEFNNAESLIMMIEQALPHLSPEDVNTFMDYVVQLTDQDSMNNSNTSEMNNGATGDRAFRRGAKRPAMDSAHRPSAGRGFQARFGEVTKHIRVLG